MNNMFCLYCRLDSAGNHQPDCPCLQVGKTEGTSNPIITCPACQRKDKLINDVWELALGNFDGDYDELEARLKKEGIE